MLKSLKFSGFRHYSVCNKSCVNTAKPTKRAVNDEWCACTCYTMECMVKVSWGPRPDLYFCDTPPHFAHRPGAEVKCLRGGPCESVGRLCRPCGDDGGVRAWWSRRCVRRGAAR